MMKMMLLVVKLVVKMLILKHFKLRFKFLKKDLITRKNLCLKRNSFMKK